MELETAREFNDVYAFVCYYVKFRVDVWLMVDEISNVVFNNAFITFVTTQI